MSEDGTPERFVLKVPPGTEEDVASGQRDILLLPAESDAPPKGARVLIESDGGPVAEGEVAWVEVVTLGEALASLGGRVVLDPRQVSGGDDLMERRFAAVGLRRVVPLMESRGEEGEDLPNEFLVDLSACSSCPFRGSC